MPTKFFDVADLKEPLPRRISTGLAKIGMALRSKAWRGAGPARLTPTQGQALLLLRGAAQPLRLDDVADGLGVTAPTASDAVAALVAKGLVGRARAADDHRAVALKPTPEGIALADQVADWPDFLSRALNTLDASEQTAFLRSLMKIIRGLQEAGDIPVQRMCVTCRYFRPNVHADRDRPHHCAFVDAPFGDPQLRLDCTEQEPASAAEGRANWLNWSRSDVASSTIEGGMR